MQKLFVYWVFSADFSKGARLMALVEVIVVLYCPAVLLQLLAPLSSITNSVALMPSVASMLAAVFCFHRLASSICC